MAQIPQEVHDIAPPTTGAPQTRSSNPYPPYQPPPPAGYYPQYGGPLGYPAGQYHSGAAQPQPYNPAAYSSGDPAQYGAAQWQAPYGQQQPQTYGQPYGHAYGDSVGIGVTEPHRNEPAMGGGWTGQPMDDDYWNIEEDKKLTGDVDIAVRMGFVRKVYGILSGQLLVTFGLALWFNLHDAAARWLYNNVWVMIIAIILMCASVCTLTCVPKTGRKVPLNYCLLFLLALSMGAILGYSTGAVDTPAFAMAAGMTAAVTIAVSLFACQTKWDFTGCGVYGFVALILLMIFGLVCAFVRNRITHIVYATLGAALFSFYIIMDTQKIVGGKHRKYQFSIDDYAFAALTLYLDIINLFMYILQILALTDNS